MNPKTQYIKNFTPALNNIQFTPTKQPTQSFYSKTTQGNRSKLTLGKNQPSQAWKDLGKNMSANGGALAPKMGPVKPAVTPSNVSATGTTGTTLPPAGKAYAQSQMGSKLESIKQGLLDAQQKLQAGTLEKKQSPEYLKYLRSLENPTEATNLQKQRENALKALIDIQTKKEQQDTDARRR